MSRRSTPARRTPRRPIPCSPSKPETAPRSRWPAPSAASRPTRRSPAAIGALDRPLSDAPEIVVGSGDATISIGRPTWYTDRSLWAPIRLHAAGLVASTRLELEDWSRGPDRFLAWFAELAHDWRGWDGERDLEDDGGCVRLRASHNHVNAVLIEVRLRDPGFGWTVSAAISVEPGQLSVVAHDVDELIRADRPSS